MRVRPAAAVLAPACVPAPLRRALLIHGALRTMTRIVPMMPLIGLAGCNAGGRLEATAQWQERDFAFATGIAFYVAAAHRATLGFFQKRPDDSLVDEMKARQSVFLAMTGLREPFVVLDLHFRADGRAEFANLERYAVVFANMGDTPMTFNRQHHDWVKDGGIELAGEARTGGKLLGRLRRAETMTLGGEPRPFRWDMSFDTTLTG
ncbi:MAG: hypothetical protein H7125_11750 [Proteobacteria bacterium]|nr:hypothetical protein [Burkholderiales bacterium]